MATPTGPSRGNNGRPAAPSTESLVVNVEVRDAAIPDAAAIGRIKRDGWRAAYRGLIPSAVLDSLDADTLAADFGQSLLDLKAQPSTVRAFLVAELDQAVIGYVIVGAYRGDDLTGAGEVYALYVDPDRWGQGTGRALMTAAEGRLRVMGHAEAALWVLEGNEVGRGFYESIGWQPDGTSGEHCEAGGAKEVRYHQILAPSRVG
jgi:GNAT superfamily N-acetyltransferase